MHVFRICSDSNSDITSVLEIVKSGANLVSDKKVDFSRNLECGLADFYGHYSSRDLHVGQHFFWYVSVALLLRRTKSDLTNNS